MSIKTLAGIFEEPKKPCKRNFVKENVKSVKQLENIVRGVHMGSFYRSKTSNDLMKYPSDSLRFEAVLKKDKKKKIISKKQIEDDSPARSFSDKSVQTLDIVEEHSVSGDKSEKSLNSSFGITLASSETDDYKNESSIKKTDHLHSEILCMTDNNISDRNKCRKVNSNSCPPDHIVLPEAEREETLKSLRQRYHKRISELNSLSLKSDTLRLKNKRTQIEDDLRKIDEEIRLFDKHNIFIKK